MKRIHINTPGKLLSYRELRGIRTPTFFDVDDDALEGFKIYLTIMGVDNYSIDEISEEDKMNHKKRTPKTGLKTIVTGDGTPRSSLKLGIK